MTYRRHVPGACPAAGGADAWLLAHVWAASTARYGVAIQAEAVLEEPCLLLIMQAAGRAQVERFMAALPGGGRVQVRPACSTEEAVARGGCLAETA